jgi:hypothetical protein
MKKVGVCEINWLFLQGMEGIFFYKLILVTRLDAIHK